MHDVPLTVRVPQSQGGPLPPSGHELKMKSECDLQQAESDLQSAVARLAAIRSAVQGRDLRHLRLQDLQVTLAARGSSLYGGTHAEPQTAVPFHLYFS